MIEEKFREMTTNKDETEVTATVKMLKMQEIADRTATTTIIVETTIAAHVATAETENKVTTKTIRNSDQTILCKKLKFHIIKY